MKTIINNTTGENLKQQINQTSIFEQLRQLSPLPKEASYGERKVRAELLTLAIDEYRRKQGYEESTYIDHQLVFLFNEKNFHDECRKMRETTVQLLSVLAHPDVVSRMEGYTGKYVGGMLSRLYFFLTNVQCDQFFTYLDKDGMSQDELVEYMNHILERYKTADQKEVMYQYTDIGMTY